MTKGSHSLINWENPKKSAIALSSLLGSLLLIKYVNIPSLLFYSLALTLLLGSAVEFVGKAVLGKSLIDAYVKPQVSKCQLGSTVEYYAPHFVTIFKKNEGKFIDLITVKDVNASFKAGLVAYLYYFVLKFISLWTLAFLAVVIAFAFPPIYKSNKELIDSNVETLNKNVKTKSDEVLKTVETKLGPHLDKVKDVASPIIKMIESKLPVRTAGSTVESKATATSTSSASHADSEIKKVSKKVEEETEVDFNSLGEQLKKEAEEKVAGTEPYSREKVDSKVI